MDQLIGVILGLLFIGVVEMCNNPFTSTLGVCAIVLTITIARRV